MDAVDFNGDSLPWSEKYRPTQLNEILAQDNIVETSLLYNNIKLLASLKQVEFLICYFMDHQELEKQL